MMSERNFQSWHPVVGVRSMEKAVDFYVDWLGVCHVMTPVIDTLMRKFKGRVKFATVDTDKYPRLSMAYDVSSFPTYIVFKGGEAVKRLSGLMSTKEFAERLEALLDL